MSFQPTISVLMLAYNHEPYIAQAIQSVLDQKTDLDFELVIGEDFSKDRTRAIILEFKEKYPAKIKVIENATNVGMHENFLRTLFSCGGKYLCVCEGDDYWNNPDKLNLQYQFLEAKPEYVLVCGNHARYIQNTNQFERGNPVAGPDHDITFEQLIQGNSITTATIMFRNVLKREDFAPDFFSIISCDWYMYMKLLSHGKFRYVNKNVAVYRINEGSINGRTNRLTIANKEMDFMELVKRGSLIALDESRTRAVNKAMIFKNFDIAQANAVNGNKKVAFKLSMYALRNSFSVVSMKQFIKTVLLISSPGLLQAVRKVKRSLSL
jgi:glycosyltransferase involved in cell wall biosynthesis